MIGFLLRAHLRWFRFLKHHVWKSKIEVKGKKNVDVEILEIESGALGHATIVCKINGHEMRVPMTARDEDPKGAIEYWLNYLSRVRKDTQVVQRKAKGWKGKKFEVEV